MVQCNNKQLNKELESRYRYMDTIDQQFDLCHDIERRLRNNKTILKDNHCNKILILLKEHNDSLQNILRNQIKYIDDLGKLFKEIDNQDEQKDKYKPRMSRSFVNFHHKKNKKLSKKKKRKIGNKFI